MSQEPEDYLYTARQYKKHETEMDKTFLHGFLMGLAVGVFLMFLATIIPVSAFVGKLF